MSRSVMLVPVAKTTGLFPATLGLVKALCDNGVEAKAFYPIDCCKNIDEKSFSISKCKATKEIAKGNKTEVLESIVQSFTEFKKANPAKVYVIEGFSSDVLAQDAMNAEIAHALDADLIPVASGKNAKAQNRINITLSAFDKSAEERVLGNIVLNDNAPKDAHGAKNLALAGCGHCACSCSKKCECEEGDVVENIVANIPYDVKNYAYRLSDIAAYLKTDKVSGNLDTRGFKVVFDAEDCNERTVLVTNKCKDVNTAIIILCDGVENTLQNKNVIQTEASVWSVAKALSNLPARLLLSDTERKEYATNMASALFDKAFLDKVAAFDENRIPLMSPATFRYKLTELARAAKKRIALPEGDEPRTVTAAAKVAESGIATPVLFGNKDAILKVASDLGVVLGDKVEFVDPDLVRANYVDRLVELRKSKGMTAEQATEMLQDNVALATMLLERDEVDGLVSGAVHTTANTIRPPLQIIKTAPNASLVSSVFFMLMPEQVYVFGDCAINPNPTSADLAEIAIQSADTAKTFGIDPRVAMVTYSTGTSGKGPDVDTVIEATKIAKEKRPDLVIDGPLQYDAAVMADVAAQKAPNSQVAGKATVFIFPSLEVGNVVYKAVQRSANLVSIGPMLQGMRKPVNDLSRGALVDDIVYTIAITAIQATQN